MSSFRMNTKPADASQNVSIIGPSSSSTEKKIESSTIDYLVTQCETLLKNNFSKYDKCIKYQENLRLVLIKANEDHKYLRAWLEFANEGCLRMKSNDVHLTKLYETLLKNNIVRVFVEHGVTKEILNLEFLSTMVQVGNLKESLSTIEGKMTSIKSDYEEMQYREVLIQISSTEESHEYLEFGKKLRLKSASVMNECEHLNKCLTKACEDIGSLKSKHDELTRCYDLLLQNIFVKEFLEYAKNQEKLPLESSENCDIEHRRRELNKNNTNRPLDNFSMTEKIATNDQSNQISSVKIHSVHSCSNSTILPPSISESSFSELREAESCEKVASFNFRLNECQEKLIAEQRRREQIEKECSSLDELSDKLCRLLLKYQRLIMSDEKAEKFVKNNDSIQNSSLERNCVSCNASVAEEFSSISVSEMCAPEMCAPEIGAKNGEELDLIKDELHLNTKINSTLYDLNAAAEISSCPILEMSAPNIEEDHNEKMNDHANGFHFLYSNLVEDNNFPVNERKKDLNVSLDHHSKSDFDNYDSSAKKFDLAASDRIAYTTDDLDQEQHPNRIEKFNSIEKNQILSSSSQANLRKASISTSMIKKRKRRANRLSYRKKSKINNIKQKYSTSDVHNNTIVSTEKKSARNKRTSLINKSTSVAAKNSSVTDWLCNICNRYYYNERNLLLHKRLVHEGLKEFKCTLCGKMLSTKQSLTFHATTHSSLKPYKCSFCSRCYGYPTLLKMHVRRVHNKKIRLESNKQPNKSLVCSKDVKRRGSQIHKKKCEKGKLDSSNRAELRPSTTRKPQAATEESYNSEQDCSLVVSLTDIKNFPEQSHEQVENEWFYCRKCEKPFAVKKNEPMLKCPNCSILDNTIEPMETKSTNDDTTSRRRKKNLVVKNSSKLHSTARHRCNLCDRYYSWKKNLDEHKRAIHEGHEDYKCPICGKISSRKDDLYKHALTHTSLLPYKCLFCHKSFNGSSGKYQHIRKVHGIDPSTLEKDPKEARIVRETVKKNLLSILNDGKIRNDQNARKASRKNLGSV